MNKINGCWLWVFLKWRVGCIESFHTSRPRPCLWGDRRRSVIRTDPDVTAALPSRQLPAVDKHTGEPEGKFLLSAQNLPATHDGNITLPFIDCTVTFWPLFRMHFISINTLLLGYYGVLSKNLSNICRIQKVIMVASSVVGMPSI